MENTDPRIFTNVRVFAGDKFKKTADASYRNFDAGQNFNVGSNVKQNNKIGTIESWGPLFRVSLDLIIHSIPQNLHYSVLAFETNKTSHCNNCEHGGRIPAIFVDKRGAQVFLFIANSVNDNKDQSFEHYINLNTWYNIIIEQKLVEKKLRNK